MLARKTLLLSLVLLLVCAVGVGSFPAAAECRRLSDGAVGKRGGSVTGGPDVGTVSMRGSAGSPKTPPDVTVDLGNGRTLGGPDIEAISMRDEVHGPHSPWTIQTAASRAVARVDRFAPAFSRVVEDHFEAAANNDVVSLPSGLSARDRAYMEQVTVPAARATYVASTVSMLADAPRDARPGLLQRIANWCYNLVTAGGTVRWELKSPGMAFATAQSFSFGFGSGGVPIGWQPRANWQQSVAGGGGGGGAGGGETGGEGGKTDIPDPIPVPPLDWGPDADFTMARFAYVTSGQNDNPVTVADASKPGSTPIVSRRWSVEFTPDADYPEWLLGGGKWSANLSDKGGVIRFYSPGKYSVTLTVRDAKGKEDTETKTIRIVLPGASPGPYDAPEDKSGGTRREVEEDPNIRLIR